MSNSKLFTTNFKAEPYWWENAALLPVKDNQLPADTDVLIVGAGYTGLHAAIQTARAGRANSYYRCGRAGWGCSTRNGGQISTSVKPSYTKLKKRYGEQLAIEILSEGQASRDYIEHFIKTENIDCNFGSVGRFHGAHTKRQYEKLVREYSEPSNPVFNTEAFIVPKEDQQSELGTHAYYGGVVFPKHASVDPAKYHSGLVDVALKAGVKIVSYCKAEEINRNKGGFEVKTSKGLVSAKKVVIATNGYTGSLTPWLRNRVISIGSYIIATEEIPEELMQRLFPTNRVLSDTRKLVYYYRPSPDRKRVLFGGRVSLYETDPRKSGPKLHRELVALFPELKETRINHSWAGRVAYTFDELMHAGEHDGIYYAAGYCGSGVGMASYLGMRIGQQVSEVTKEPTAFSKIPFKGRPYYNGIPWFLAPSVIAYRIRDRVEL